MDTQENCAGLAASRYPYLGRAANRGRPAVGGAPVAGGLKLSVVNVPQPQAEAAAGGSTLRRRRSNTTRQASCQLPWGALLLLHPELNRSNLPRFHHLKLSSMAARGGALCFSSSSAAAVTCRRAGGCRPEPPRFLVVSCDARTADVYSSLPLVRIIKS
jgi:hypothetical protein